MKRIETASLSVNVSIPAFTPPAYIRLGFMSFNFDVRIHGIKLSTGIALPAASDFLSVFAGMGEAPSVALISLGEVTGQQTPIVHIIHSLYRNIGSTDNLVMSKDTGMAFADDVPFILTSGEKLGIYANGTLVITPPPGDNYNGIATANYFYSRI